MKLECVQFWPTGGKVSPVVAREKLPVHLRKELIEDAYGIQVDATKSQVIEEIEKVLRIGKKKDFVKHVYAEVDKREIDDYTHFFILPQQLDYKEHVFYEVTPRACKSDELCPWGVEISSPVSIRSSKLKAIGSIMGPRVLHSKLLVVTQEMRQLFDSEGISGLQYEYCKDLDEASEPVFLAKVVHGAYQVGTDISTKACPKHWTTGGGLVFDLETPREAHNDDDFQMIDRFRVKGREYLFYLPLLVVSRKLLRLLFKHEVPGLQRATWRLNQKFRPLIVS